jgi:hypothetical protein
MDLASESNEESSLPHLLATLYKRGFTGRVDVLESKG